MLNYEEFKKLKYSEHQKELDDIQLSLDIEWKQRQLELFEKYVKEEYRKYIQQFGVKEEDILTSNELKNLFVTNFLRVSVNNIIPAKISFYFIISLILKGNIRPIKYEIDLENGKKYPLDPVIHVFWSQDSSSGKSEGKDFVEEVIRRLSKALKEKYQLADDYFDIYDIDWTETPQTFINHFEIKYSKKGASYDFSNVVKGILESTDAIFSDEAAYLLEETIRDKQSVSEILLTALEGRPIDKTLVGWNGRKTTTNPKFLFYGISRPISKMNEGFLQKGLFQRMLAYFREITTEQRIKTFEDLVDMKFIPPDYDVLVDKLMDLIQWKFDNILKLNKRKFLVWNPKHFTDYLKEKGKSMINYISKEVKSWTTRKVLTTFVGRYYMKVALTLFVLEAFSRKSFVITKDVMDEVFLLLDELLKSMIIFTEYHLEEPRNIRNQRYKARKCIHEYFSKIVKDFECEKVGLIKYMQVKMELSPNYVEDLLYRFQSDGVIKIEGEKIKYIFIDEINKFVGGSK